MMGTAEVQVLLLHNANFEARRVHKYLWFIIGRIPVFGVYFSSNLGVLFQGLLFFHLGGTCALNREGALNAPHIPLQESGQLGPVVVAAGSTKGNKSLSRSTGFRVSYLPMGSSKAKPLHISGVF